MSRRVSLPGADELFRSTAPVPAAEPVPTPEPVAAPATTVAPAPPPAYAAGPAGLDEPAAPADEAAPVAVRRRPRPAGERRPSGRERHEEKITVYCSADELIDLERSRLALRGDHGLAVDRGRIVREALAIVLADLDAKGEQSVLVRRLRGR
jgi:hypothetical protein